MNHIDWIQKKSQKILPISTGLVPTIHPLPNLRKIIFDVYGTLLVSGVGDISTSQSGAKGTALQKTLFDAGFEKIPDPCRLETIFVEEVLRQQSFSNHKGIEYPEVDICEVWRNLLHQCNIKGAIHSDRIERLAISFECQVNPVWPMPRMLKTLRHLRSHYGPMGIVSNAQFFTPLLFPALTGKNIQELGFDPSICIWSYQQKIAKPSLVLFQTLLERLGAGIHHPSEVLYVGNDMRNDIATASRCGMRTALFAGDQRSLRLREEDPFCQGIQPDWVITDLGQLFI